MATDLVMPTLNTQQSAHYFPERPQHHRSQSYQPGPRPGVSYSGISSLSSSNSSGNSPTSPKPYQTGLGRQARPLFIPAALRPNEFPSKPAHAPKTSLSEDNTPVGSLTKSGTGFLGLAGSAVQRLTRRSTGDSGGRALDDDEDEDELDADLFPGVTALPTKRHWKPDSISPVCDDPTCKRAFGYFTRRHHCRRCGNIFCDFHSSSLVPLDQDANYNPRGAPSRACDHCHGEFQSWKSRTGSRASSSSSSEEAAAAVLRPKATARPAPVSGANLMFQPSVGFGKSPAAAASVPRDWNWSTF